MSTYQEAVIKIGADVSDLMSKMRMAESGVSSAMSGMERTVGMLKGAMGALGVAMTAVEFVATARRAIDAADAMNDLSQRVGIAVKDLAKYELASSQSGTTMEALAKGIKGLGANLVEHGDALKKAGITARDANGALMQVSNVFAAMPDGIEKTNLAVKLFGKSGMELIPMLNMGSEGLETAAEKSQRYAIQMAAMAPVADAFNDNMAELALHSKVASMSLVNDMLPGLVLVTKAMADAAKSGSMFDAAVAGIQTLFTGDDMHKANVKITETMDLVMSAQKTLDHARATGDKATIERIEKIVALRTQELNTHRNYKKMLEEQSAGPVKPDKPVVDPMASYKAMMKALGGDGDANKAATEMARLVAAGKELTSSLIQQDNGLSGDFLKKWESLGLAYRHGATNLENLTLAQAELLKQQPLMKAAVEAKKKAMEDEEKYNIQAAEAHTKYLDTLGDDVIGTLKEIQAQKEYNERIGMTTDAVHALDAARIAAQATALEVIGLQKLEKEGDKEQYDLYRAKAKALRELSRLQQEGYGKQTAFDQERAAQVGMWQSIEQTAHTTFTNIFEGGQDAFTKLRNTLQATLLDLLYQMTVKKWIFDISASVSGQGAAGAAFPGMSGGSSGGVGSLWSTASNANSLYTTGSSVYTVGSQYFGGTMSGANAMGTLGANATGTGIDGLLATNGAYGTAAGSSGAAAGAGSTGAGAAGAGSSMAGTYSSLGIAGLVLYGMHLLATRGGEYVKATGSADSNFNSTGMITGGSGAVGNYAATRSTTAVGPDGVSHTTTMPVEIGSPSIDNTFAKNMVRDANSAYLNATQLLGIKAVDSHFTYNSNSSDGGKFALTADAGGKSFNSGEVALNDNALKLAAGRAVITALQGSELPAWMSGVFDNLNASTLDQAGVDATITHAGQLREAFTALSAIPNVDLTGISYDTLDSIKGVSTELAAVDTAFSGLGYTLLDISAAGGAAAAGLSQAFGGLQALQAQMSSYAQNYLSQDEQQSATYLGVQSELHKAGIDYTLDQLRAASRTDIRTAVDAYAASVTTTDGQTQYAAAVKAANTLATVKPAFETTSPPPALQQQFGSSGGGGGGGGSDNRAVSDLQSAIEALAASIHDLRLDMISSGPKSFTQLQAQFAIEAAKADAKDQTAIKDLPELAKALAESGKANTRSALEQSMLTGYIIDTLARVGSLSTGGGMLSVPGFDVGTDYVPRDMLAMVHEGERITPKAFNPTIGNSGGDGEAVAHAIASLGTRLDKIETNTKFNEKLYELLLPAMQNGDSIQVAVVTP